MTGAKSLALDARDLHPAAVNGFVSTTREGSGAVMGDTCRVYAAEGYPSCNPKWSENEMLEFTACERRPNSRLLSQLSASPEMGSYGVHLMETRV